MKLNRDAGLVLQMLLAFLVLLAIMVKGGRVIELTSVANSTSLARISP